MGIISELSRFGKLDCLDFCKTTDYEVLMGSHAYGVDTEKSDIDVYSFVIPPEKFLFPNRYGYIQGFGKPEEFEQYQQHHIDYAKKEYDIVIYNISKYCYLCYKNNPNLIDSLFVPDSCIINITQAGRYIRSKRHIFLSKQCYHTFCGYSRSQLKKGKEKSLYHSYRLYSEGIEILKTANLNLQNKERVETMKDIRSGNFSSLQILNIIEDSKKELDSVFKNSNLPDEPDFSALNKILYKAIFFGKLY